MRVAALYDVHGNLPALEAVLAEVGRTGVDAVVVGGDVLPGAMPSECLTLLHDLDVPTHFLRGNGEVDVLTLRAGGTPVGVPEVWIEGMRWVADRLSDEVAQALRGWPLTVSLPVEGLGDVLFCHATPRSEREIFTEVTPEARLRSAFDDSVADVVICGHTHMQFDRRVGAVRVVNAGSVGMPFAEPGAYWALLGPGVELRRTTYDLERAAERIVATGHPDAEEFARTNVMDPPPAERMRDLFEAAALR